MSEDARRKILVVDDEPDAVEFVRVVLEEAGYEVISAGNGAEGLTVARAEKPDLVVLDVLMPEKDGFSAFSDMRRDEALKSIPVVMLTGVGEQTGISFSAEAMGEFLGEKPDAYVEKPIDPEALQQTVAAVLSKSG